MSLKDIKWKLYFGASQKKSPLMATDIMNAYRMTYDPYGMKLEQGFSSIEQFLESIPGFIRTQDNSFTVSERNALAFFKKEAVNANKETRAAEAFGRSFARIYKRENVEVPVVEKDLLAHYCLCPPPSVGFLEMSRLLVSTLLDEPDGDQDEEVVKKCFNQFERILLLHSRALYLFEELPEYFTAEKFVEVYRQLFGEIDIGETGFDSVQELLEWLPELLFSNYHFSIKSGTILNNGNKKKRVMRDVLKKFPRGILRRPGEAEPVTKKVRIGVWSIVKPGWAAPRNKVTTRRGATWKEEKELVLEMDGQELEDDEDEEDEVAGEEQIEDEVAGEEQVEDEEEVEEQVEDDSQLIAEQVAPDENMNAQEHEETTTDTQMAAKKEDDEIPKPVKRGRGRPRKIVNA